MASTIMPILLTVLVCQSYQNFPHYGAISIMELIIDPPVALIGSTVNISCRLLANYSAEHPNESVVLMRPDNQPFGLVTRINSHWIVATIPSVKLSDSQTYKCKKEIVNDYNNFIRHELQVADDIRMDSLEFDCVRLDFNMINCSWNKIEVGITTNVTAYITQPNGKKYLCDTPAVQKLATRNGCFRKLNVFHESIDILVIADNHVQTKEENYTFPRNEIVRLSPVTNFAVTEKNSTYVKLKWKLHEHPYYIETFVSNVTYSSLWGTAYRVHKQNTSRYRSGRSFESTIENKDMTQAISDLIPATTYNVAIIIKLNESRFWSEPVSINVMTDPARKKPPVFDDLCKYSKLCTVTRMASVPIHATSDERYSIANLSLTAKRT